MYDSIFRLSCLLIIYATAQRIWDFHPLKTCLWKVFSFLNIVNPRLYWEDGGERKGIFIGNVISVINLTKKKPTSLISIIIKSRLSLIVRVNVYPWIWLLLLTVTDVTTTCAVVIFRVKVSCTTSVIGIVFWLLTWLTCQLSSYFSKLVLLDSLHKSFVQCW